jgi:inner membrane protein
MTTTDVPFTNPPPGGKRQAKPKGADWGGKALLVCALALLMAIPGLFIWALIAERANRAERVTDEVSALQGGAQQVLGPLLVAPYVQSTTAAVANGGPGPTRTTTELTRGWYVVSAATGEARLTADARELKRGIFPVPVYRARVDLDARFGPAPTTPNLPQGATVDWSRAQLVMGFTDLRGAKADVVASVTTPSGARRVTFTPAGDIGLGAPGQPRDARRGYDGGAGFGLVTAPAGDLLAAGGRVQANLQFTGAQRIAVLPFARSTRVTAAGRNGQPKFDGGFIPDERKLEGRNFEAVWRVPFVARGLADHGPSASVSLAALGEKDLGVTFVRTNNPYQNVIAL